MDVVANGPTGPSRNDTTAAPSAISVDHLRKTYSGKAAVDDLSFSVRHGEVFALLGPNGAGKTTTVEILEGYRPVEAGSVRVLGLDPVGQGHRLKPRIGVMLQQDGVYPILRAREVLELFARFFSQPEDPTELLQLVGLSESANVRCRQLSGGQKRRLALALALVGKPEIVFLDEPTTGMDPQARHATWDIIRSLRDRGTTVLLTTHYMEEADQLADRVAIIDGGKLIALDTPEGLKRGKESGTTEVRFNAIPGLDVIPLAALPTVLSIDEVRAGRYVARTADVSSFLIDLATWLKAKDGELSELRVGRSSLEDVFISLTGKDMRE